MTGFRIPAVAISPYVKRGRVHHAFCTFESILKLVSYKFGLGYLTKRHRYATNIGRTMEWEKPNFKRPNPQRAKPHDLVGLETSGLLDRLGYDVKPPTYSRLFRNPDSFRRALRASTRHR